MEKVKNNLIIHVDQDDVLCGWFSAMREAKRKDPMLDWPQSKPGFFRNLKPLEGAIEGFNYLFDNYDTHILTRPSILNPHCYTEKREWVEEHLGMRACEKLMIVPNKALVIGDYLIDDQMWPNFKGTQLQFGSEVFPNWTSIIEFFKTNHGKGSPL